MPVGEYTHAYLLLMIAPKSNLTGPQTSQAFLLSRPVENDSCHLPVTAEGATACWVERSSPGS